VKFACALATALIQSTWLAPATRSSKSAMLFSVAVARLDDPLVELADAFGSLLGAAIARALPLTGIRI
jgi:hypothetical protein